MDDADFALLLDRVRAGDEAATVSLLETFETDLRIMVRNRLPQALRSQFDSMDFVQAVWTSVLAGGVPDEEFATAGRFRGYIAGVARNKVFEAHRRRTTRKFDLGREEPLYVRRGGQESPRPLAASDPSPSQNIQADEFWDRMLAGGSAREAEVMGLRRQGMTCQEIADRMGLSERAVRRAIEEVRKRVKDD